MVSEWCVQDLALFLLSSPPASSDPIDFESSRMQSRRSLPRLHHSANRLSSPANISETRRQRATASLPSLPSPMLTPLPDPSKSQRSRSRDVTLCSRRSPTISFGRICPCRTREGREVRLLEPSFWSSRLRCTPSHSWVSRHWRTWLHCRRLFLPL